MGHGQAKGSVHVCVDKPDYSPGEEVSGLVYLYLQKKIRTETLWLKVKCKEECHWKEGRTSFSGMTNRLRQKFPLLKQQEKEFKPGSYSVPFSVELPSDLPGSFRLSRDSLSASIIYKIKAEINGKKTHLTHHHVLTVKQHPTAPQQGGETISTVRSCCTSRGEVKVRVGFERPQYCSEEVPRMLVEVDNSRSSMAMARMAVSLYRVLRLRSAKKKTHVLKLLLATVQRQERIPPRESLLQEKAVSVPIDLQEFRAELDAAPSVSGEFVECKFIAEVELFPSADYCKPQPPQKTTAHVFLLPGKTAPTPLPVAPEDWSPVPLERASLSVQPQFDYNPSAPSMNS